ncbi:MAG: hypothetical protein ACO3DK_00775 [Bacteroidia bacterium]
MKKMMWVVAMALSIGLWSCSESGEHQDYTLDNVNFIVSGPIYEGSETAQYEIVLDESLRGKVVGAKLKSARIHASDSAGLSMLGSVAFSMVGNKADMGGMAVLNPVPSGSSEADLSVSAEADPTVYFEEGRFYLVMELGINQDWDADLSVLGDFVFDLEVKK